MGKPWWAPLVKDGWPCLGAAQTMLVDGWDPKKHSRPPALLRGHIHPWGSDTTTVSLHTLYQGTCLSPQSSLNNPLFMTAIQIPSSTFCFMNGPCFQEREHP